MAGRQWFVQAFNQDYEGFETVREQLGTLVYRPITPVSLSEGQVQWFNEIEVTRRADMSWERINAFSKGFFFHATSEKVLEAILKAKKNRSEA